MALEINALQRVLDSINEGTDFLLQGGAGCGKTETLSRVIAEIALKVPNARICCITHTNKAADEIRARSTGEHTISTIHSFLNKLIKNYKKNIHHVIHEIFEVPSMVRRPLAAYSDEKGQKVAEHERYKKIHEKYAARHWTVHRKSTVKKPEGKKIYDTDPIEFNRILNCKIDALNDDIKNIISEKSYSDIRYNETRFDSFKDLTYGHDGLLKISELLFNKYPLLAKILNDKFDCIFIDEYQDTNPKIIEIFFSLPEMNKPVVGLFGDSMQSIYSDGVGDVGHLIASGKIRKIEKLDNFRCSDQVTKFINRLRNDKLEQNVAYKMVDGILETIDQRRGNVELFYKEVLYKPHSRSAEDEKTSYLIGLNELVTAASFEADFKTLLLSNKAVAQKAGFENLYDIFSERYVEPKEEILKILTRLHLLDLYEICEAYSQKKYNVVLSKLRANGLSIQKSTDKSEIAASIQGILSSNKSAMDLVEQAFEKKLIRKSDSYSAYLSRIETFLKEIDKDKDFLLFETDYNLGHSTFTKMSKLRPEIEQEFFDEQLRNLMQKKFYNRIFSTDLNFLEIIRYFHYEDERTPYVTMHKTKGTGIDNVLVVLDEYFWNDYDFQTIFDADLENMTKREKNLKLVYVACSRAKVNLRCVRLVTSEEKDLMLKKFEGFSVTEI